MSQETVIAGITPRLVVDFARFSFCDGAS